MGGFTEPGGRFQPNRPGEFAEMRIPPLDQEVIDRVLAMTFDPPPKEATHWTEGMMAEAAGISVRSVQRIWRKHGLQPHRVRQFKLSNDPAFAEKLRDIVGLAWGDWVSRCNPGASP